MGLIDRNRLIEDFKLLISRSFLGETTCNSQISIGEVCSLINEQPIIDIEPIRHGHWIEEHYPMAGVTYRCSVCGNPENKHTAIKGHYCWFCGAKMDDK